MNLTIDIGNTRTKLALFQEGRLLEKWIQDSLDISFIENCAYNHPIQKVILSSVASPSTEATDWLRDRFQFLELSTETPLPIRNHYRSPQTLGKDRLAAVVGAFHLFPRQNCMVIDAGSCITYDLLQGSGDYWGGNISPGLDMRLKAMHQQTARLPLVPRVEPEQLLGYNTESALQNGALLGAAYEMEGFIAASETLYGKITTVLTGGDAIFFEKHLKRQIFVNQNLVLIGLNKILDYNAS
ncbi:MAG: type III pantothenate kinase [Phaeodactylibacter sp.]|nr:type III pantothenate kinase [Phaeodactylibacter sp.]